MSKPDPRVTDLHNLLQAFLRKHPDVAGVIAAGIVVDGGKYLLAAAARNASAGEVQFDSTATQEVLCEAIAWNRVVARERHMRAKATAPASKARN